MGAFFDVINKWSFRLVRLIYLNLIWIMFSLFGLVILGIFPATVALFAVVRKQLMTDHQIPIFRNFWRFYYSSFLKSNLVGILLISFGYILYLDYMYLAFTTGWISYFLGVVLILFTVFYFVVLLYVFPVIVHYNLRIIASLKQSLLIGVFSPLTTLLMIGSIGVWYIIMRSFPLLIPFFSVVSFVLPIMTFSFMKFTKIENKTISKSVYK